MAIIIKGIDKISAIARKMVEIKKKPKSTQAPSGEEDSTKYWINITTEKTENSKLITPKTFVVFSITSTFDMI